MRHDFSGLQERLKADMKDAMKAKNQVGVGTVPQVMTWNSLERSGLCWESWGYSLWVPYEKLRPLSLNFSRNSAGPWTACSALLILLRISLFFRANWTQSVSFRLLSRQGRSSCARSQHLFQMTTLSRLFRSLQSKGRLPCMVVDPSSLSWPLAELLAIMAVLERNQP